MPNKNEPLKVKLLVEVEIGDVETKYPNYRINFDSKKNFLERCIVPELNYYIDEKEHDAGYEYKVANELLDTMHIFISIGDKVMFNMKHGYMGKHSKNVFGIVSGVDKETSVCKISYVTDSGKKNTASRDFEEVVTIYDFLEAV